MIRGDAFRFGRDHYRSGHQEFTADDVASTRKRDFRTPDALLFKPSEIRALRYRMAKALRSSIHDRFTAEEVAAVLGITPRQVRYYMQRAGAELYGDRV